ncbi:MAG TPA: 2,3-bisphosphoglycerate-independent phosphoglycerate mutase [Dongiaceae bacterium]|jgi:2,3-bisphosphoglycerate-independent phosphoglycerate mutase
MTPRPVVLCILDGWGHASAGACNAVTLAKAPTWQRWMGETPQGQPHALIDASELAVGLPAGQMGNSEVGHMNIGAGRVVMQDLPRIDAAIESGELARNPRLLDFIAKLKASGKPKGGRCHLLGLLSPGGVHSHQHHMAVLAKLIAAAGVPVLVHAFLDGRDTPPQSALGYLKDFAQEAPGIPIATVGGRYYAMDRDKRWERLALAYANLVEGAGEQSATPAAAVEAGYARGETDEFVKPTAIAGYGGMDDGDGLLMANFRADRVRQLQAALLDPDFTGFARNRRPAFAAALGMGEYAEALNRFHAALFPAEELTNTLGELVSRAGRKQLRIAETEKYAHVTFFFNGGEEKVFPGEERILIPSPKVATYDLKPEMSAYEMTDRLVAAIGGSSFDFIVVNFANTDMVGHSGRLAPAIAAVEAVDRCLGRLEEAVKKVGGVMLVTADHGNAEMMCDPMTGGPHTAHTLNRVPLVLVNAPRGITGIGNGRLADIAPTLLALMGMPQPASMTGHDLLIGGL